jgi:two-component system, OmpR family, sensor histidine kinase KdpD
MTLLPSGRSAARGPSQIPCLRADNGDVTGSGRVAVAVSGGPETGALLRRAASLAGDGDLLAVHVLAREGRPGSPTATVSTLRRSVEDVGGTLHTVLGGDVAQAVAEFAAGAAAGTVVVGLPRNGRLKDLLRPPAAVRLARLVEGTDVRSVAFDRTRDGRRLRRRPGSLSARRTAAGWALAVLGPAVLTALLVRLHASPGLSLEVLVYLALTVAVAITGGLAPAVSSALLGFLSLNYFFTPPTGHLLVSGAENVLVLTVFVLVAVAVASVVGLAGRRSAQAFRARVEAAALAEVSRSALAGDDTASGLADRLRETFSLTGVSLLERADGDWRALAVSGAGPSSPRDADAVVPVDDERVLAVHGRPLPAGDRLVLEAFASQTSALLERRRLRELADQARVLEEAEATRTALLAAVSHDLRTPLATIRAAVDGLLAPDVTLSPAETEALVATVSAATAHLERLIDNLLDLSRLQSGSVRPVLRATALDEVVPLATEGLGGVSIDMPDTLPLVRTDPGLLERALANVVSNAVRHSAGSPVRITATPTRDHIEVRVIDTGPGLEDDRKARMFEPFQRLGDTSPDGLGLGLAVTEGLATAVGAGVSVEDTPGGGLTMVLRVPRERRMP